MWKKALEHTIEKGPLELEKTLSNVIEEGL